MLAGLETVGVAFLAFATCAVALVGIPIVRPLLVSAAGQLPIIGGPLASQVDNILRGWQNALAAAMAQSVGLFVSFLDWLRIQAALGVQTGLDFVRLTLGRLHELETVIIPAAGSLLLQQVEALMAVVYNALGNLIQAVRSEAVAGVLAAQALAQSLFNQAEADINAVAQQEAALVGQAGAAIEARVSDLIAAERAFTIAEAELAGLYAAELFNQARTYTDQVAATLGADFAALVAAERSFVDTLAVDIGLALLQLKTDADAIAKQEAALVEQDVSAVSDEIKDILNSPAWQLLLTLLGSGDALLAAGVNELTKIVFQVIREQINQVPAWKTQLQGPIETVIAALEADLAAH